MPEWLSQLNISPTTIVLAVVGIALIFGDSLFAKAKSVWSTVTGWLTPAEKTVTAGTSVRAKRVECVLYLRDWLESTNQAEAVGWCDKMLPLVATAKELKSDA